MLRERALSCPLRGEHLHVGACMLGMDVYKETAEELASPASGSQRERAKPMLNAWCRYVCSHLLRK